MTHLTLTAQIKAKTGKATEVEQVLRDLIAPTRAEEGCIAYDLHADNEDESNFVLIETWESVPQWKVHMQSPHMKAFDAQTGALVEDWKLTQLTKLV